MTIEEMTDRISEIRSELDALAGVEEATDETEARFDELVAEFDELREAKDKAEAREAKLAEIREAAKDPQNVVRGVSPALVGRADVKPYNMETVRSINMVAKDEARSIADRAVRADDELNDASKERIRSLIDKDPDGRFSRHVVAASSPEYREAFAKILSHNQFAMTDDERAAVAAVRAASLTDSAGGYAVPTIVDPTIVSTKATEFSQLRQIAKVDTTTVDVWRGLSSAGITASYGAEGSQAGDNAPTLAQPTVSMEKATAFVPASIEVSQDWRSIAEDLADMFAEAKEDLEATEFITGDGSDAPTGLITALLANSTTTVVDTTTASTFGSADVYALQEALPVRHRQRAGWGANNTIINDIRQFGTAVNHVFTTDLTGGISKLMERPLYEFSAMDSTVTTNAEILVFGDFSKFLIVDRIGMNIEYIPHLFHTDNNRPSGQRGWYAWWRNGSNVLDANAFRVLQA